MSTAETKAWYGHVWVWVVLLIPFSAVVFGIFMILTALIYPDDTVVDDYYKEGLAINKRFLESGSGLLAQVDVGVYLLDLETKTVGFDSIPPTEGAVSLNIFHVADSTRDMSIALSRDGEGNYVSHDSNLYSRLTQPGVWYLEFMGPDDIWKLRKRLVTPVGGKLVGEDL